MIVQAADEALRTRTPLPLITASGGARMQEGVPALMQMAKTSVALAGLDEAGVLTISLITDPTFGGVAASFATLSDVIVSEPGARLGFAGPRVVEQTIRKELGARFQTAEFLVEDADELHDGDPWELVKRARDLRRPTTLEYVSMMTDDFLELHGDRMGGDCSAIVGGIACFAGCWVVVVGHQNGHTVAELTARNFGMARPAGYRKAGRLMRIGAKLNLPVITLIDTPGAYPGIEAEENGQAMAIAENLRLMASLPVPIVAVITGEGGSGGALGLAVADRVYICSNAVWC